MKKFLLSIGLVSAFAANAQYTITSASNPVAGDMESTIATNTAGLTLPASGSGQVWNYSTVTTGTNSANTTTYVAISSVPNANLFAGSTLGGTSNGTNYDVYQLSGTVRNYLGTAVATASDCEVWSNPATIITLPFTFGSTSNDNFALTNSQYTLTGNIANSGDGKGTLTLPSGTFNNVLKVSSVITETATGTGFVITVKVIQHQFFSAASKFPLFSVTTQTNVQNGTSTTMISGSMNNSLVIGIKENTQNNLFSIYPNPATSKAVINFNNQGNTSVTITLVNALGQEIKNIVQNDLGIGENSVKINLENVPAGVYFITVKTGAAESVKKLVIE